MPARLPHAARIVDVRRRCATLAGESDAVLAARFADLRGGVVGAKESADAAALAAEAVRRATGKTLRDVQLAAGLVLADGRVAEMATGEGKTLTAAVPACLLALGSGKGRHRGPVHVAVPNAYLAARDHAELAGVFGVLGLTSALLPEGAGSPDGGTSAKKLAYETDVVYGTGYEFGFDFLRDQAAARRDERRPLGADFLAHLRDAGRRTEPTQPPCGATVLDEADSALIDEALTPLVLAGGGPGGGHADDRAHRAAADVAGRLEPVADHRLEVARRRVALTDAGLARVTGELAPPAGVPLRRPWGRYVEQALHAALLLRRDVDYVVRDEAVRIVDAATGRVFEERTWRDGLHQAVEVREGVTVTDETTSTARVTRQRFYRLYDRLCGMTGTAAGAEAEMKAVYGLGVVPIPPHRPCRRAAWPTRYFADETAKNCAVAAEAADVHAAGRPVLVGTRTIDASTRVSAELTRRGVPHVVLNGVQDADEADLVAAAGRAGAVTVATNMAGRGTDIRPDAAGLNAGGLHVIGTERHESGRVDRQLAGRAARQGDPGSCRFFVAADDDLLARHAPRLSAALTRTAAPNGECRRRFDVDVSRLQTALDRRHAAARRRMTDREAWLGTVLESLAG